MITYVTGDLLKSSAVALVNTVNCEGYMGKGLAYQFQQQYPKTNLDYEKSCKIGSLKIGTLHYYYEKNKVVINFPTKDKWREKSKIDYIYTGLDELLKLMKSLAIKSIAIPPLGSGNGGLSWSDVKEVIEKKLSSLPDDIEIFVYEPSVMASSQLGVEPKLNIPALVLMEIKPRLIQFTKLRLHYATYFTNLLLKKKYFSFRMDSSGLVDYSIDLISQNIKEFQNFHATPTTDDARKILYSKLISASMQKKLSELLPKIEKACTFVNQIKDDRELEALSILCFLLESNKDLQTEEEVFSKLINWYKDKGIYLSRECVSSYINTLHSFRIIDKTLTGYTLLSSHSA